MYRGQMFSYQNEPSRYKHDDVERGYVLKKRFITAGNFEQEKVN